MKYRYDQMHNVLVEVGVYKHFSQPVSTLECHEDCRDIWHDGAIVDQNVDFEFVHFMGKSIAMPSVKADMSSIEKDRAYVIRQSDILEPSDMDYYERALEYLEDADSDPKNRLTRLAALLEKVSAPIKQSIPKEEDQDELWQEIYEIEKEYREVGRRVHGMDYQLRKSKYTITRKP